MICRCVDESSMCGTASSSGSSDCRMTRTEEDNMCGRARLIRYIYKTRQRKTGLEMNFQKDKNCGG